MRGPTITILFFTLASMGILCSRGAEAQIGLLPKFRIKAGIFNPASAGFRAASSGTWFKVGADVSLPLGIPLISGGTRIGIDYMESNGSRIVPITLMQILQPSAVVAHSPIYLGAGAGLWNARVAGHGSGSTLGARFLVGFDISSRLFIEAQYDVSGKVAGTRIDGLSVLVGTKF